MQLLQKLLPDSALHLFVLEVRHLLHRQKLPQNLQGNPRVLEERGDGGRIGGGGGAGQVRGIKMDSGVKEWADGKGRPWTT
jgi:hypothetical protein